MSHPRPLMFATGRGFAVGFVVGASCVDVAPSAVAGFARVRRHGFTEELALQLIQLVGVRYRVRVAAEVRAARLFNQRSPRAAT